MRYYTMHELEAREQELTEELNATETELAIAKENGDTDIVEQLMEEIADMEKELDEVMNRWGTIDRYGYDPENGYYDHVMDEQRALIWDNAHCKFKWGI